MTRYRIGVRGAIGYWLASNEADGLAVSTLANQRSHMRKLEKAVIEWEKSHRRWQPMQTDEIDGELVTLYLARCTGEAGNRGNMLAALRQFMRYCERQDFLPVGTTDKLLYQRRSKQNQRKPKIWIPAEKFCDLLDCQTRHPSDRMTMALLLYTLARKSELYALKWANVDFENRVLHVYRSKLRRWTTVGICPELYGELLSYMHWYIREMGALNPEWYVLPEVVPHRVFDHSKGHYGSGTTYTINPVRHPCHMEKIVKRALDAIGATGTREGKTTRHVGEGAHTIRRSGARALLKSLSARQGYGDALATVSAMLDHQDVKVTLRYIGMEQQKDELNEWLKVNSMYGSTPEWVK